MKHARLLVGMTLLAACSSGNSASVAKDRKSAQGVAADDRHPVVVELYQSQGCSSCPPANANLNAVAGNKGILALSFAVTYWDRLGWKDRFARPEYTQRQWDYANATGRGRVYTPQVIVNGRAMMVGGNKAHFARLIAEGGAARGGPTLTVSNGQVVVGPGKTPTPANVWLVRYDPRTRNVAIRAGENGGRTLPHRNIVTELRDLGRWTGREMRFTIPPAADAAIRTAVFVQQGKGGPIVSALKL